MRNLSPALWILLVPSAALGAEIRFAQAGTPKEIETRARSEVASRTPGITDPLSLSAELGTALSRGNTETFHISGSVRLTWAFADRWVSETKARALYEESYGRNTANGWGLFERVDRFLTDRFATFAALGIERDVFAGIDGRYSGQLGASFLAWEQRAAGDEDLVRNKLSVELGFYGAYEKYMLPPRAPAEVTLEVPDREIYAGRAASSYLHTFRKGTSFGIDVELIQDFNDTENFVVNDTAYVTAAVVDGLALKLSFTHRFDAQPASEELEKNNLLLTAGIVVSF